MHYIDRYNSQDIIERLKSVPAVAILGSRQCGKSTLANHILKKYPNSMYLDLELPSDLQKLSVPELFFQTHENKLICLDEIQRVPNLFPVMRSIIDKRGNNGQFLILGSASRDLIKQSSETLAGRISYTELTPFLFREFSKDSNDLTNYWLRGGYPRSLLANNNKSSFLWRIDFIRSFVERDILQFKSGISSQNISRLLTMCAHMQGQTINYSKLGSSMSLSDNTIRHYLDLLQETFVVRILKPFHSNLKKRLVKAPKIYIRDSGIFHALLGIDSYNTLLGHPCFGSSWEGLAIENILSCCKPEVNATYFRTTKGEEIDLILERGIDRVAIEFKAGMSPEISRSMHIAIKDVKPLHSWIVAPVKSPYPITSDITVSSINSIFSDERISSFFI